MRGERKKGAGEEWREEGGEKGGRGQEESGERGEGKEGGEREEKRKRKKEEKRRTEREELILAGKYQCDNTHQHLSYLPLAGGFNSKSFCVASILKTTQ